MIDVQKYRFSFEYASLPNFNHLVSTNISPVCVASPQTPCSRNSVNSNLHLKIEDHLIQRKIFVNYDRRKSEKRGTVRSEG